MNSDRMVFVVRKAVTVKIAWRCVRSRFLGPKSCDAHPGEVRQSELGNEQVDEPKSIESVSNDGACSVRKNTHVNESTSAWKASAVVSPALKSENLATNEPKIKAINGNTVPAPTAARAPMMLSRPSSALMKVKIR
jgi:hypothetical protein